MHQSALKNINKLAEPFGRSARYNDSICSDCFKGFNMLSNGRAYKTRDGVIHNVCGKCFKLQEELNHDS